MKNNGERIAEIISRLGVSKAEFARKVGERPQTVSNWVARDNAMNVLNKIFAVFPEINQDWLITGHGDMMSNAIQVNEEEPEGDFYTKTHNGTKFYELPDGKYRMEVDRVPWGAYGRFANECNTLEPDKEGWSKESFYTDKIVHGRYLAFEVRGDSMDDGTRSSFEEGDVVLVRELDRIHWRDGLRFKEHPYWVVVFDSSVLIKQIVSQNLETGELTFHSLNNSPEYSDFPLSMDRIRALYYVLQKKPKTVNF